jgi:small subunit ribosomal protein S7
VRKKRSFPRVGTVDPKYNDLLVSQFVNNLMSRGKKHTARRTLYEAFNLMEERSKGNPLDLFKKAVSNARPMVEVKARPTEVRSGRSTALAIRWLIGYARERKDKSMSMRLAAEFLAAASGEGSAIKKKEDTHKMAEANKAFAHFRW